MRTLRTSRSLRGLALAAFCCELILAFAHIHDSDHPGAGLALACHNTTVPGAGSAAGTGTDEHCPPSGPAHDDDCPICMALALAGPSVLPTPPVLPAFERTRANLAPERTIQLAHTLALHAFQARAPPQHAA